MAVFIVTYDLRQADRDYAALFERLGKYTNAQPLKSAWFIESGRNAAQIRDDLLTDMDAKDGLLIMKIEGQAGWNELDGEADLWLTKRYRQSEVRAPAPEGN